MNERIRELAEQAHLLVNRVDTSAPDMAIAKQRYQEAFKEKFAELIVKECAIIANRAENTETELRCMYDVITEHFGVEE